jgi:hypothetical protein
VQVQVFGEVVAADGGVNGVGMLVAGYPAVGVGDQVRFTVIACDGGYSGGHQVGALIADPDEAALALRVLVVPA